MRKNNLIIILVVIMLVSLTACAGKEDVKETPVASVSETLPETAGDAGYYVMASAIEDGVAITSDEVDELGMDAYILLNQEGAFASVFGDDIDYGTWEKGVLDFENEEGEVEASIPYTLEGDELTIDWGEGFIVSYVKSNDSPPEVQMPVKLSELQELWDGDWYGYYVANNPTENYKAYCENAWSDCFAKIQMNADDTGTIYLWDPSVDLATVEISISQDGDSGPMGIAVSESGIYWNDTPIDHADWEIDPSLSEHENYMVIDAPFDDGMGEGFDYEIHLIPWGQTWDDFPEDQRPPWFRTMFDIYSMDSMLEALRSHDWGRVHSKFSEADPEEASSGEAGGDAVGDVTGERINTGVISALCPYGWKNYEVLDNPVESDDINPARLEFHKGAEDEVDRYTTPSVEIYYFDQESDFAEPIPMNFVSNSEEWGPQEFSGRSWKGFSDADTGDMYIWTQEADYHLMAKIYIEGDEIKISLEDEDVQGILASIGVQ